MQSRWNTIVEEEGFCQALDCDILFSCVDRPWPRSVLNFIAYAHLIPVVDGGIKVGHTRRGSLRRADWRAHIASPGRKCLECLGQYDPGLVSAERDGYLDDPRYIDTLPEDHPIRRNENVFAFSLSLASMEILEMLAMVINPLGICNLGAQSYHLIPGITDVDFSGCEDTCYYQTLIARGDCCSISVTGQHARAEEARSKREKDNRTVTWLIGKIKNWILGNGR